MSNPELSQLRTFMTVARLGGFRRAALALNLSVSNVSQAVRALEAHLSVPLLARSTRGVALTQAGTQLLGRLELLLGELDAAFAEATVFSGQVRGRLRLNVPRSAADLLIAPLVGPFLRKNPDLQLEVATNDGYVDIVREGFDAGIRFPESVPADMVAVPIGPSQRFVVVASPQRVATQGLPQTPGDLEAHPCVQLRFPSGVLYRWQFRKGGRSFEQKVDGPLVVDDQHLALRAALDGVGWAYIYEEMARPYLQSGHLVQALPDHCPSEPGFQLYYPGRRQVSPALRALIHWISAG